MEAAPSEVVEIVPYSGPSQQLAARRWAWFGCKVPRAATLQPASPDDQGGSVDRVAVARDAVAEEGVLVFALSETDLVAWHLPDQASSLEDPTVAGGSDIGSVAVYEPVADGETLTFTRNDGGFTDTETGSTWNILGEATDGPLAGQTLRAVPFIDTFWFTWATFQPDTRVVP